MSNEDDLKMFASVFANTRTPMPNASPFYETVADALVWNDEVPSGPAELWWAIRPVLRHRTCLLLATESQFDGLWSVARTLFPDWIGFRPDRCTPSDELRVFYFAEARRAAESFKQILDDQ